MLKVYQCGMPYMERFCKQSVSKCGGDDDGDGDDGTAKHSRNDRDKMAWQQQQQKKQSVIKQSIICTFNQLLPALLHSATIYCYRAVESSLGFLLLLLLLLLLLASVSQFVYIIIHYRVTTDCCHYCYYLSFCIHM